MRLDRTRGILQDRHLDERLLYYCKLNYECFVSYCFSFALQDLGPFQTEEVFCACDRERTFLFRFLSSRRTHVQH